MLIDVCFVFSFLVTVREWKEKYDTVDNVEEDTLTFTLRNTWIFRPDLSVLTGEEIVTLPHPLMMGALLMVQRDREAMLPLVTKGINILFNPLESAFLKVRIMDVLFDGIYIDCSSPDFAAKALCSGLDSEGAVSPHNDTHYKFSFFGMRNHTEAGRWVVYRGVKNTRDLGRVISYNDETEMDVWDGDECNQYIGTDSTIFPPFLTKQDRLWAWSPEVCRSLGAHYVKKSKYAGLPMSYFELDFGDPKTTGSPVSAAKRLQFSMELGPIHNHELFGQLPHVILPMFWAEEGASLNKTWTNQLKYQLFLGLKFNATVKWLTIIIGTVGAIGSAYMHFRKDVKTTNVTPVAETSPPASSPSSGEQTVINVPLGKNLPSVIDGLDKPPKLMAAEIQRERY
uniref:Sensory neuron membrane protein 1 n=1 Tax=Anopheles atroparvus TaxID=41427 RepID=A0A182JIH4_ANOAO